MPMETKPKKNSGRTTKLTPQLQETIVNHILRGSYMETAAAAAGIDKTTLYRWLKQGADAISSASPYYGFRHAVESALAEAEVRDLNVVDHAARSGVWKAAAWKLERRAPKRWGKQERVEVTAGDGEDNDGLDRLAAAIARLAPTQDDPQDAN